MKYYPVILLWAIVLAGLHSCGPGNSSLWKDLKDSPEMDTSRVKEYVFYLERKIMQDPRDSPLLKQRDMARKYLQACSYYEGGGWSWVTKSTGMNLTKRMYAAADLLQEVKADTTSPLYYKALYLRGRIFYWLAKEDSGFYPDTVSENHFTILSKKFPGHEGLKMYRGEKIAFYLPDSLNIKKEAPLWARYQLEATKRMIYIIHWWVKEKQALNGELGGKYGDDVEMLRWWLPAVLGADDSLAALGYTRLADGVWNSGLLENGFARRIDDVEHSAELFRDTHPAMFLIKYGDPEYIERCMISMQNFTKVWTGITPRGHRHFKSYFLSAQQVRQEEPYGVDVPLNARAVLAGLWLAWYNRNPSLLKSFEEWGLAWVEDAERTENGKPRGVIPAAVVFNSDKIGGFSGSWFDAELSYNYYRWESLGHIGELYSYLLGMYAITKNDIYLKPVKNLIALVKDRDIKAGLNYQPGSIEWVKAKLSAKTHSDHPLSKIFSMAERVTGDTSYHSLLKIYGDPYNVYQLTGEKEILIRGLDTLIHSLRYNLPMLTNEVKFTDRVYVPGSNILLGMYTGHFGGGYEFPDLVATWKNTGAEVAVLVHKGNKNSASVSLFNNGAPRQVTMRTWQLEPGWYLLHQGIDSNSDGKRDSIIKKDTIKLDERVNDIKINLPSGKNILIAIEQIKRIDASKSAYPDAALNKDDIRISDSSVIENNPQLINTRIHNTGNAALDNALVFLYINGKLTDSTRLPYLEAPNDLSPRYRIAEFAWLPEAGSYQIGIKVVCNSKEITLLNNYAERTVTIKSR